MYTSLVIQKKTVVVYLYEATDIVDAKSYQF
jgi:hypothetical protein